MLYATPPADAEPNSGPALEQHERARGHPRGPDADAALADGPGVDLFEFDRTEPRAPARPCDLGLQHLAL